jgi:hypothetical protein
MSALETAREQAARAYEGKATGLLANAHLHQGQLERAGELAQALLTIILRPETGPKPMLSPSRPDWSISHRSGRIKNG